MNNFDKRDDIFHWRLRQDAVAQVKDVSGSSARLFKNPFGLCPQVILIRKKRHWIEIAHHRYVVTKALPALIQTHTPVESNDVATGFAQQLQ